jgi:acetyltransferase-like isoleucine patch superfamily enzyme
MKSLLKKILHSGIPVPAIIKPLIRGLYSAGVFVVESFAYVKKLLWVEPVLRSVCAGFGGELRAERLPYMRGRGKLYLGKAVNLSGRSCFYFMRVDDLEPEIRIGDRTFIGDACTFSAAKRIVVGDDCLIAALVRVHDNDGHPLDAERRLNHEGITAAECADVVIGNNVWIGAGATILKGVTIGDNAVIATGAIVTSDVAANSVVAGNPAREVKSLKGESRCGSNE